MEHETDIERHADSDPAVRAVCESTVEGVVQDAPPEAVVPCEFTCGVTWAYLAGFFDGEGTICVGSTRGMQWSVAQAHERGRDVLRRIQSFLAIRGIKSSLYLREDKTGNNLFDAHVLFTLLLIAVPNPYWDRWFWVCIGSILTVLGAVIFRFSFDAMKDVLPLGIVLMFVSIGMMIGGVSIVVHDFS